MSALADRSLNFYVPGSMGPALALGLGTALNEPVRWTELGHGLGYRTSAQCHSQSIDAAFGRLGATDGPHLVVVHIGADPSAVPPRVTKLGTPARFRAAVARGKEEPSTAS